MTDEVKVDETEKDVDEGRRKTLKKLGTVAYAAPVMMSLLASKKASASSHFGAPPGGPP